MKSRSLKDVVVTTFVTASVMLLTACSTVEANLPALTAEEVQTKLSSAGKCSQPYVTKRSDYVDVVCSDGGGKRTYSQSVWKDHAAMVTSLKNRCSTPAAIDGEYIYGDNWIGSNGLSTLVSINDVQKALGGLILKQSEACKRFNEQGTKSTS